MKDQRYPTLDEWVLLHGDEPDTTEGPHLISVDELRAAGALDVPAEWRKSLGGEERRHLLPGFDDDEHAELQPATQTDSERDETAGLTFVMGEGGCLHRLTTSRREPGCLVSRQLSLRSELRVEDSSRPGIVES